MNIVQILYKYCPNIILSLSKYCISHREKMHHLKHALDLEIASVKCFNVYIFLVALISKDLRSKQICWAIWAK